MKRLTLRESICNKIVINSIKRNTFYKNAMNLIINIFTLRK